MPSDSIKPVIFISYAHADEPEKPRDEEIQWLSFVMKFLRPAVKFGEFRIWVDPQIPAGTPWDPEIEQHLEACSVFLLLVSANSMASDYIIDKELAIARRRQAAGAMQIYPLLVEATPKAGLARIRDLNVRPPGLKPLQSYPLADRNQHMSDAADEIADMVAAIAAKAATAATEIKLPDLLTSEFQGIAEAFKGRQGVVGPATPDELRPRGPAVLDISRLPETGYQRLVGRDAELKRLDEAWSDGKINILSLVAEGGAGKSALVNEWLTRLRADSYRGATVVLGWSFFSQGSKERATAADEFLDWALAKLGAKVESTSATAKGDAIAEALTKQRVLLILDGVEPLQHGPGPQSGELKDQGLRALLRRLAAAPPAADHGLIVLTSRVAVADIQRFKDAAPVVDVERLSDEAGAELLRDNDVWGIDKDLKSASRDFGGHPLALTLLASFLKETQNGDVRRRDHLRGLLSDADNPRHDQARRVMESYEKEWLADQPALLAILECVGLFDRPASGDCVKALRKKPAVPGLTDALVDLSEEQWRRNVERLRELRLLAPADPSDPDALDAHPLVREWFGERLRRTNEAGWKAAHSRLYDHLRRTTHEGRTPTLADLAPLYHAVPHGCQAGRHQEALIEVYQSRICRREPGGAALQYYAVNALGAVGSSLAAISWFFERPYERPVPTLAPPNRVFVLGEASFALRAQGRLNEALPAMRLALEMEEGLKAWSVASVTASNLAETELVLGNVAAAAVVARRSVALADRGGETSRRIANRATLADALYAAGQREEAASLFADAERRQREWRPGEPLLYSLRGYRYCDLLLSEGRAAEARDRAIKTLELAHRTQRLLDIALNRLTLSTASLALALAAQTGNPSPDTPAAGTLDGAVESLRAAGRNEHVSSGLIARAALRRSVGDWDGAKRDLDEAQEIAAQGPMRLYLCDIALERTRIALARREAFAPLNGVVEPSPPPPAVAEAGKLTDEARDELEIARKLIAECGYHRRDEELAELDQVLAGRRRFADLPPRV